MTDHETDVRAASEEVLERYADVFARLGEGPEGLPVLDPHGGTVVIAGDWHGDTWWARGVVERAARASVHLILHVGDLGVLWPREGGRFDRKLTKYLTDNDAHMMFVDGNHDSHYRLRHKVKVNDAGFGQVTDRIWWAPRGHRFMVGERTFGAVGGAFSVDWRHRQDGMDWWPNVEEVQPEDIDRLGDDEVDVLLAHDAPTGVPMRSGLNITPEDEARAEVSRDLLAQAVNRTRPKALFNGHWHQRATHQLRRPDGGVTRVESLAANTMAGDAVLLDLATLRVSPLPRKSW